MKKINKILIELMQKDVDLLLIVLLFIVVFLKCYTVYGALSPIEIEPEPGWGVLGAGVVWADYDADGDFDLAIGGYQGPGTNCLRVYKNNGDKSFNGYIEPDATRGIVPWHSSLVWADYDNDNDLDIIIAGEDGPSKLFRVYVNNGDGTFSGYVEPEPGWGVWDCSIACADYDNDGDVDIAVSGREQGSGDERFRLYINNGDGTFNGYIEPEPGWGLYACSLAWGDYDSDGDYDLAITGYDNPTGSYFRIYKNKGDGTFDGYIEPNLNGWGPYHTSIAWGDYDQDNDLDIAVSGSAVLRVYTNSNGVIDGYMEPDPGTGVSLGSLAWGDYDADGDLDLAVTGSISGLRFRIYTNNGDKTFAGYHEPDPGWGVQWPSIAWGDFDNDRDLDIAIAGDQGGPKRFRVYTNTDVTVNNPPAVPTGMYSKNVNGFWRFNWNYSTDDHTIYNLMQYRIAISTSERGVYNYISDKLTSVQGQANIGNIPQGWKGINCYYQSKIPYTQKVFWKVCAIDTGFQVSDYCDEQLAGELYSVISGFNPSEDIYFYGKGKITGESHSSWADSDALDHIEIRIKNLNNSTYFNGSGWTLSSNTWIKAEGKDRWEYNCQKINWEYGVTHQVVSRPVTGSGFIGARSQVKEFIPVYQLSENSFISYPNPFDPNNQTATIEYLLTKDEKINLIIYDLTGQIVYDWTFYPGNEGAKQGLNRIIWDGKNKQGHPVANGVYFTYLKKGQKNKMTKIMVVK